jgi:imidazole glycerol-phosphate synthase subunit HisH
VITVIDYGMGNSGSIMNILRRIGAEATLTSDLRQIAAADKLVLPGVGAFDQGMERLNDLKLTAVLNEKVMGEQTPILGICLGMQLFARGSEEGNAAGLAWIDAKAIRFQFAGDLAGLKIPHMGWNTVTLRKPSPVFENLAEDARFYFVHSYHVQCADPDDILTTTRYGIETVSSVARGSVIGVQFHPEKSLRWGMEVFRKFVHHVQRPEAAHHSLLAPS